MRILLFIIMILPGIIAARVRYILYHERIDWIGGICQFAKFACLITFVNLCFLYFRGWGEFAFEWISVTFAVKYMVLSLILAILLPVLDYWILKRKNRK